MILFLIQGESLETGSPTLIINENEQEKTLSLYVDRIKLFGNLESKDSSYLGILLLSTYFVFNIEYHPQSIEHFYKMLEKSVFHMK